MKGADCVVLVSTGATIDTPPHAQAILMFFIASLIVVASL